MSRSAAGPVTARSPGRLRPAPRRPFGWDGAGTRTGPDPGGGGVGAGGPGEDGGSGGEHAGVAAQRVERPVDEAAGRLGRDVELLADLAEALALAVEQPEAGLHGEPGPRVERLEQLVD